MGIGEGATVRAWGTLRDGRAVDLVELSSGTIRARISTFGAVLQGLLVPDRDGRLDDIVFGHDDLGPYENERNFFGATIGRYANRIAGGTFELDGRKVSIEPNDGPNALHGGSVGFDRHLWQIEEMGQGAEPFVRLARVSPDGEEGFPGTLHCTVTYRLRSSELEIAFEARTDEPTVVNLTNHSFFNLSGSNPVRDVLGHRLTVAAERFLPVDGDAIPLGEAASVADTPFDFREGRVIGEWIRADDEQIRLGRGYDHNFCLDGTSGEPALAAIVEDPLSGRVMHLLTDQPGLQVYSGNFLDGTVAGKNGLSYRMGDALCLEPQRFPDTPNRPGYPTARLDPGEIYRHRSIYRFSTT
ncbi:aldose epimerase family protein [Aureimonas sp. ME7]|uniref:aldose epimerase family protein n=1 Tax=Aureimonas sp. ME7 TaxID=2744252 RepID=UPI0015F735D2|nr:aldose epimerase family protein [Aureimonas sp. ME7]